MSHRIVMLNELACSKDNSQGSSPNPIMLTSGAREVSEVQEELVKLNLKIKLINEEFVDCNDEEEMEELNGTVREHLNQFRNYIDRLKALASQQKTNEAKTMLLQDVENHQSQLAQCQKQFRDANLKCILSLQKRARDALFQDGNEASETSLRQRRRSRNRDEMAKEASKATDSLMAMSRQLFTTVERSAETIEELTTSSQVVSETQEEFKTMGSVIGQSRKLITKYGRRETTDRVLIFFAFAFFFACVFYILRKRVLGPLDPLTLVWNLIITLLNSVIRILGL